MSATVFWLIVVAICGTGWLICHYLNRRDRRAAERLDCAQDQAIGITRDGSHDSRLLSAAEEFAWREIEREWEQEAR